MKDKNKMYQPSKNWSIDQGDYKRDEQATWSYHKKQKKKGLIKTIFLIIAYAIGVSGITYLALTFF